MTDERLRVAAAQGDDRAGAEVDLGPVAPPREAPLTQLEAATRGGSVFVVRDGGRRIAATTRPEPTVGLVFYDLKSCLRQLEEEPGEKPKRRPRKKKAETGSGDAP